MRQTTEFTLYRVFVNNASDPHCIDAPVNMSSLGLTIWRYYYSGASIWDKEVMLRDALKVLFLPNSSHRFFATQGNALSSDSHLFEERLKPIVRRIFVQGRIIQPGEPWCRAIGGGLAKSGA